MNHAALITFALGDEIEAIAILVVLLLNALLGFVNEYRAERSVQALKALAAPLAKAIRDGDMQEIPAADLVPGDLITFEAGDRVPVDARLTKAWNLRLDESALTGESVATDKDSQAVLTADIPLAERATMVYTGTAVVQGRGQAIVTATGSDTEIGRISALIVGAQEEQTPLQGRLDRLGRYLALTALGIAAVMVVVGLLRGEALLSMLETSLALAIAAVPEGLPAVATIALALGMRRMAQRRAIVRRLAAVETLGSTNVICSDKTGTLTQNQMTVRELWLGERAVQVTGAGYEPHGEFWQDGQRLDPRGDEHLRLMLRAGLLCSNAALQEEDGGWDVVGDPTEGALVVAAAKAGVDVEAKRDAYSKVVFANVRKFVHYLFSCNLSEILTMFVAIVAGLPLPLLPLQILWLNLITDVFPALALAGEPAEPGIMQRSPPAGTRNQRPPTSFVRSVVLQGALLAAATLVAFMWALNSSSDIRRANTVAFLTLGLAQLFHVFNSRFETGSALRQGLFSNRYVWAAIVLTIALQLIAVYLPVPQLILKTAAPSPMEWGVVLIASLTPALTVEIYKALSDRTRMDEEKQVR
ncbi:MAG TPA: HAD-IC family P-type ATPase [Anaerolineae bacterium]|nr:HAD-IC family P-type ATPase [Anaerolineae bacterium]